MTEEKFIKKQERVLYNIARALKFVSIEEVVELTGNSLNEKQVKTALLSLERRKLIKKSDELYGLNIFNLERIKKLIGVHWEENWEEIWKNATGER